MSSPPAIDSIEDDITAKVELGPCTLNSPYRPLDRSPPEIRVLELIEPSNTSSMIHGRLQTATLQPGLSFTALSYVWGNPALNEEMNLNGEPFRITKSLANALRWVKHHWLKYFPGRDGSELRIWADAVCINQEDKAEKSFQVPLMGTIYDTAELVISSIASEDRAICFALKTYGNIWKALTEGSATHMGLNELTDQEWMRRVPFLIHASDNDEAVHPEQVLAEKKKCFHQFSSFFTHHGRNIAEAEFLRCCMEQNLNPTYLAFKEMSVLPYWSRVWVVQEILLGERVLFICDDTSLDVKVLDECTSILHLARTATNWVPYLDHRCWQYPNGWCAQCWDDVATVYDPIIQSRRRLAGKCMEHGNFHHIMVKMHSNMSLKATDPKDLVYGLLGLSKIDIAVDYSKDLGKVYGDYVRYCLNLPASLPHGKEGLSEEKVEQRCHFLLYGGIGAWLHDTGMPSWVPNFQRPHEDIKPRRKCIQIASCMSNIPETVEYPDLSIPGISIQLIMKNGPIILGITKTPKRPYRVDKGFLSHLRDLKLRDSNYITGIPILQAVCRALIQDDNPDLIHIEERLLVAMLAILSTVDSDETHRIFDPKFQRPFTNPREAMSWYSRNLGISADKALFHLIAETDMNNPPKWWKHIEDSLQVFSFFETRDGYLGLGPLSVAPDDELCLFRHCPIPVILRRNGDHYKYVGPCWVVGLDSSDELERLQSLGRVEQRQFVMR
ncbi:heterokaryon incompatibility protein-domain-containing protein [Apiospora arundinis]|uniref:Heterokaryon incompatibility protein-domain-containing protein n=1 Tax=Apiospora arundinis TaxID=335852 RepID=A0ABR2JI91_9PEZI